MSEFALPYLPRFLTTSGLWTQHGFVGNSRVVCSYGLMMKATSREQNGQSKGDIHSTTISGWGLGCTLGNVDINWLTNLRLCRCDGFAFFGGGGGGGSLAAILRLRLRGGSTSFGAEVKGVPEEEV